MAERPHVGIVTRTKNRPVLLKRAIESVLFQTYPDWEMVIVNDGGDPAPIDDLIAHYADSAAGRLRVVHNPQSMGMEGASAVGIAAVAGDVLAIHDDDDSWAPSFLALTTAELHRLHGEFPSVQGVTTFCNLVMEHVHGNIIEIDSVEPFNNWQRPGFLSLDRMLVANFLPPISFLFTRHAFEALSGKYEAIPYLGDWDFMIRFLSKFDVYLLPQYLAFYHWRTQNSSPWLGNTVTDEVDRHQLYRQLLLNQWLRADLSAGRFGLGAYANLRSHLEALVHGGEVQQRALQELVQKDAVDLEPQAPPRPDEKTKTPQNGTIHNGKPANGARMRFGPLEERWSKFAKFLSATKDPENR